MKTMKKTLLILPILLLFAVFMVSAAQTLAITTPAAAATISGATYMLNATVTTTGASANTTNITWSYACRYGGTKTAIVTTSNASAYFVVDGSDGTKSYFNYTWNSAGITDCGATFYADVYNGTVVAANLSATDTNINVIVNNTSPTLTEAATNPTTGMVIDTNDYYLWKLSSTEELASATLYINGVSSGSFSRQSSDTGYTTWQIENKDVTYQGDGNYDWYISTVESAGDTTVTTTRTSTFNDGSGGLPPPEAKGSSNLILIIIAGLVVFAIANRKKK